MGRPLLFIWLNKFIDAKTKATSINPFILTNTGILTIYIMNEQLMNKIGYKNTLLILKLSGSYYFFQKK